VAFQYEEGESAGAGARRMAREQLGMALARLGPGDGPAGDRGEVVHEVRRRIKKARALLRLARPSVGRKSLAKADRRLRDAARPLSEARDASAQIGAIDDLAGRFGATAPPGTFDEARRALVERGDAVARLVLDERDALAAAAGALRLIRRRLKRWDLDDDDSDPVDGLKHSYGRARGGFDTASADPTPESLHEWRKRVKAFAYQLRALRPDPSGIGLRIARLAGLLGDELGQAHDLDVLRATLTDPARALAGPAEVLDRLDHRRDDLRRSALQRGEAAFRAKPGAFARSLRGPARHAGTPGPDRPGRPGFGS